MELVPIAGPPIPVPDPDHLIHLQFRRFAGCPVCNLHIRSLVRRRAEIEAAGVREVLVFHSSAEELREHDLPFEVVADPGKKLYVEYGVEASPRALLDPRAWLPILRGVARSLAAIARGREKGPRGRPEGGRLGLPADFLIAPDGTVLASKHGKHVYDQWSVDEILAHAGRHRAARSEGDHP
jgi:hypothetical protein